MFNVKRTHVRVDLFLAALILLILARGTWLNALWLNLGSVRLAAWAINSSVADVAPIHSAFLRSVSPYHLGWLTLFANRDPVAAESYFRAAVDQNSHGNLAGLLLAEALRSQNRQAEAIVILQGMGSQQTANFYARSAMSQLKDGAFTQAEQSIQQALAIDPQSPAAYYALCQYEYEQGAYEAAVEACRRATEYTSTPSQLAGPLFWLGATLNASGQPVEAIAVYRRALDLGRHDPSVHVNLGRLYTAQGDYENAEKQLLQAIEWELTRSPAYLALGDLAMAQGQHERALSWYEQARKAAPNSGLPDFALGQWAYSKGDLDEALFRFQRAVQLQPDHIGAWANLGRIYRQRGHLSEAIQAYRHAIDSTGLSRKYLGLRIELARTLEEWGDVQGAREVWVGILQIDPRNKDALAYLAEHPER
jgi:tetratricopeptide (TPR) repeat protein